MEVKLTETFDSAAPENRSFAPVSSRERVYSCPPDAVHYDSAGRMLLSILGGILGTLFLPGQAKGIEIKIIDMLGPYSFAMATPVAISVNTAVQVDVSDTSYWGKISDCRSASGHFRADVAVTAVRYGAELASAIEVDELAYAQLALQADPHP